MCFQMGAVNDCCSVAFTANDVSLVCSSTAFYGMVQYFCDRQHGSFWSMRLVRDGSRTRPCGR